MVSEWLSLVVKEKLKICWCDSDEARAYVKARRWEELAGKPTLFTRHRGNSVWVADIAPFGKVVVKESRLDDKFPLFERIGREIRLLTINANLRDAKAAHKAEDLGVATYHPIAVWEVRNGLWTTRYIMYTYVEGRTLKEVCRDGAFDEADRPAVKRHLRELGAMTRRLHDGGLRHRDLVPNNVVIRPDGSLAIIDFSSGYPVRCKWPRYRRTQDFASLRRFVRLFDADCLASFCEGYCGAASGRDYEHALLMALFWKYNGSRGGGGFRRLRFWRAVKTAHGIE